MTRHGMILCAMLLTLGCLSADKPASSNPCPDDSACLSAASTHERSLCLLNASLACSDKSYCDKIEEPRVEYQCRMRFGEYDIALCLELGDKASADECLLNGALRTKDTAFCWNMTVRDDAYMCVSKVAMTAKDRRLCNSVLKESPRDFCFAVADRDGRICGDIADSQLRDRCVDWIASDRVEAARQELPLPEYLN